eukprot:403364951
MQSSEMPQIKLRVHTCTDVMRSILAYIDKKNILRIQRVNSHIRKIIFQTFTKIRNSTELYIAWKLNLDADSLILEQLKRSQIISLVCVFTINIPDLAALMLLPEILCLIQSKQLQDRRLFNDSKLWTVVILKNVVNSTFIEDGFDQFEIANRFKQFKRQADIFKMIKIRNEMAFSNDRSRSIKYQYLIASENIQLDYSILKSPLSLESSNMNLNIIDLILKKTVNLQLDSNTYNIIPSKIVWQFSWIQMKILNSTVFFQVTFVRYLTKILREMKLIKKHFVK